MSKRPLTIRAATWSAIHPWRAMALWVVFVAVCFAAGSLAGQREMTDSDMNIGESTRAGEFFDAGGFSQGPGENVLITARSGRLDQAAAGAAANAVSTRMKALPEVADVDPPVPSPDGRALLVQVTMTGDHEGSSKRVESLLDATAAVQGQYPSLRLEQAGDASINKAVGETADNDFLLAEALTIPATVVILLLAFGALIAAGVPVLLGMSAVGAAIGFNALASHLIPTNESTNSVILCVGLAVGVDYSLFYLRREREERARGRDHLDAVELAAATSGHAVVVSGLSVIVAMAGLFLAQDAIFSSFAVGAILVVSVSVLGSLTVLPAMLAKLGRWIDRPRVPLLWRLASRTGAPRFWPMVLRPTLRYPRTTLTVSVALLLALATPALGIALRMTSVADLPRDTATIQAYDRIAAAFPRAGTTHQIAVRAPAASAPQVAAALDDLVSRTRGNRLFTQDETLRPKVSADGTVTVLPVTTSFASGTSEADQSLETLRQDLLPATVGKVSGAEYAVGGEAASNVDYANHIKEKLPLVIGLVLLLTLIVMTLAFRSVVVAVKAALLNLLSVGAAYGVLVLVFQHTWAEGLLGFKSNGAVTSWLPLFLFVILFGLSMDYHVFVVSRIREAVLRGVPNRQAVVEGIVGSAGVVTSAAAIMVAVFSIFGTLSMLEMKQMGVGLAVAIAIDATIIRAVVLPSAMILLGNANWWAPRFLRRRDDPTPGQPATDAVSTTPELTVGAPR